MRRHAGWKLIVILGALSFAAPAPGQDEATDGEEADYTTVVTGTRFEDDELDSPRSIEVIDSEDIKKTKARSTPEMLQESTGVFVQKTAHGHGAPIIRGCIGINNLVLFNEIKLNNSTWRTGPIQYLNLIDPFSIEKIEILRGPGSLLYGSDAVGGVVSIFGKRPSLAPGFAPGYILKGSGISQVVEAIRRLKAGATCFAPDVEDKLSGKGGRSAHDRLELLTEREKEVLQLIAEGRTSPMIADALGISVKTAETHRTNLMTKLDIHNTAGLVRFAVRMGLVRPE